jgi:hypothetical protein
VSVNATEAQARRRARQYPLLGAYIARIEIPPAAAVRIERMTRIPGHYTIWASSADLLGFVVAVVPV